MPGTGPHVYAGARDGGGTGEELQRARVVPVYAWVWVSEPLELRCFARAHVKEVAREVRPNASFVRTSGH